MLFELLLPPPAVIVETRADRLNVELFPEEERALGRAVEKRRREFITGRACAREALARLGLPPVAIGSGRHGEPIWPPGVVGSITHCEGYRACAVARTDEFLTIGIDAERDAPLPDGVWETIAHGRERTLAAHLQTVLFSAKEAIYKAWFGLSGEALGWADAELWLDPAVDAFTSRRPGCVARGRPSDLSGRWAAAGGVIATAVAVSARADPDDRSPGPRRRLIG